MTIAVDLGRKAVKAKQTKKTSRLSYRDWLENQNFICSQSRYNTFQKANNKGIDQTAGMRRLVTAFVVRKMLKTGSFTSWPVCHFLANISHLLVLVGAGEGIIQNCKNIILHCI